MRDTYPQAYPTNRWPFADEFDLSAASGASKQTGFHESKGRSAGATNTAVEIPVRYIVAGWFTRDYRRWAERFRQSLIEYGAPHEFIEIDKPKGAGWERTTRLKAGIALAFMDRHPEKTIILSDVDALATGDLSPLAAIDADIALRLQCKRLRGRNMFVARLWHPCFETSLTGACRVLGTALREDEVRRHRRELSECRNRRMSGSKISKHTAGLQAWRPYPA
jgi:hypothetical protein